MISVEWQRQGLVTIACIAEWSTILGLLLLLSPPKLVVYFLLLAAANFMLTK